MLRTCGDERVSNHLPASFGYPKARYLVTRWIRPERGERRIQSLGYLIRKEGQQFELELTSNKPEDFQPLACGQDRVVEIEKYRTRKRSGVEFSIGCATGHVGHDGVISWL